MLEFIFFHHNICKLFTDFIAAHDIEYSIAEDDETITVSVSEDIDDERVDQIEDEYDRLLDLSHDQTDIEEGESRDNYQKASLLITLSNGDISYAHVDTDIVNRMLQVISTAELNHFIEAVADAVENPDERSYCQTIRDGNRDFNR